MKTLIIIATFLSAAAFAQTKDQEIARLKAEIELLKKRVENAEAEAKRQEAIAKRNELRAQRERYIAQAKAMALKSQEMDFNVELESLVAQQAYLFNKRSSGYEYDNDVYNGLYYALKNNNDPITSSLAGHTLGAARSLVSCRANGKIYSGGSDGKILQWTRVDSNWQVKVIRDGSRGDLQIYSIDIDQSGKFLVAGGMAMGKGKNFVEVYELAKLFNGPTRISGFAGPIGDIKFNADGTGFYVRDEGGRSILFSDMNGVREVVQSQIKISSIDVSPDGKFVAGAGDNGILYLWDISNNYESVTLESVSNQVRQPLTVVKFAPDSQRLLVGDYQGLVKMYEGQKLVRVLSGHDGPVEDIEFNHKGDFIATASKDKSIRLWNTKNLNSPPTELTDHGDWVWSLAFAPDDRQLMAGLHSTQVVVRNNMLQTEESIRAYPTSLDDMANILCEKYISRNMLQDEWGIYCGMDLSYERTCPALPANK